MPRLVQTMQTCLQRHIPGLLVAGHGLYAWGESLSNARRHVEILEFLLSAHWMSQLCPNQPARGDHENTTPSFDIEGTTCPVSFVSEILFPYARESLGEFISNHQGDQDIRTIIRAAADEWVQDNNKTNET